MNEFDSISEFTQSRKDKINSKDITERFLSSLFDSSVMSQTVGRVCTHRSLIDRGCGIEGWLEKISKTNSRGVGIEMRVGRKWKF